MKLGRRDRRGRSCNRTFGQCRLVFIMPGLSDYADCRGMSELLSAPPATVGARQPSTSERETTRGAIAHVIYTNRTNRFRVNCPARRTHRHFVFENFVKVHFSCSTRKCSYSQNYTFVLRRRLPPCCVSHSAYVITRHNYDDSNRSCFITLTLRVRYIMTTDPWPGVYPGVYVYTVAPSGASRNKDTGAYDGSRWQSIKLHYIVCPWHGKTQEHMMGADDSL